MPILYANLPVALEQNPYTPELSFLMSFVFFLGSPHDKASSLIWSHTALPVSRGGVWS